MSVAKGYKGTGKLRRPSSLLEACIFWDRASGGTIHQYLPRLRWERATGLGVRGIGPIPVWKLMLDTKAIGWIQCYKRELPSIDEGFPTCYLDYLPEVVEWFD